MLNLGSRSIILSAHCFYSQKITLLLLNVVLESRINEYGLIWPVLEKYLIVTNYDSNTLHSSYESKDMQHSRARNGSMAISSLFT